MKIKGIKTGSLRGDIIELTPTEKIEPLIKELVPSLAPAGEMWWAESIKPVTLDIVKGRPYPKGYANNTYHAVVEFGIRPMKNDRLYKSNQKKFKVSFKDVLDKNGFPDLQVISYEDLSI